MFKWDLLLIQLGCKLSVPALLDSYHLCWANQANTGPYFIHRHAHISAKLKTLKKKKLLITILEHLRQLNASDYPFVF